MIGRSRKAMDLTPAAYRREIAGARTFGMMRDVERYWKAGFALGASLENTVAVGETAVVNPEGLRYADEFVRHKFLDAVGDLALAGLPLQGAYRSYCGGHRMNVGVLDALFCRPRQLRHRREPPAARRETSARRVRRRPRPRGLRGRPVAASDTAKSPFLLGVARPPLSRPNRAPAVHRL